MSRGINKVIIVGRLGTDPSIKYMPSNSAVLNMSIATSESWKDKKTGEIKERTEWHKVVFYARLAEIVSEYCKKGDQIYLEGRLKTSKYTKDGVEKYSTEIVASEMQMLGGRGGAADSSGGSPRGRQVADSGQPSPQAAPSQDFDDDIPF